MTALFETFIHFRVRVSAFPLFPLSESYGRPQAENECHLTAGLLGIETIKGLPVAMLLSGTHRR